MQLLEYRYNHEIFIAEVRTRLKKKASNQNGLQQTLCKCFRRGNEKNKDSVSLRFEFMLKTISHLSKYFKMFASPLAKLKVRICVRHKCSRPSNINH